MAWLLQPGKGRYAIACNGRSVHIWLGTLTIIVLLVVAVLFPVCFSVATNSTDDNTNNIGNDKENNDNPFIECGVYLAPSSIPGSGLGMYLGNRSLTPGQFVTAGDIVIPIVERPWHNGDRFEHKTFLWTEYTWSADTFWQLTRSEIGEKHVGSISMASPGAGAAANCYMSMVNTDDEWAKISRAGVAPESPGQGAFTTYYDRSFYAIENMVPGQEIFISYGSSYFDSEEWANVYLPMWDDFKDADMILTKALISTLHNDDLMVDTAKEIWQDMHSLLIDIGQDVYQKTSRILNAVPSDPSRILDILLDGGTAYQDYYRSIKDLQWLEKKGQCMDNIAPGTSTIPDAGRGAFTTRFIPSGGLVSPSPLIHVGDLNALVMFPEHIYNEDDDLVPNRGGVHTWQLLLNYCFGHKESTLLLCPYGLLSSLINHGSSGDRANTKIQWSDKAKMRHPEWMDQPIHKWESESHSGLQLDFVATRDIEEGEEILIDYGDAWLTAWDHHAKEFRFEDYRSKEYKPSYELNDLVYDAAAFGPMRTEDDRDYRLDEVQLYCRSWYLQRHGIDVSHMKMENDDDGTKDEVMSPMCTVLKQMGEDSYLVRLVEWVDNDDWDYGEERGRMWEYFRHDSLTAWGVPRDAFFFEDLPYSRDMHQEWAFRHPMMIPDKIFPDVWKNVNDDEAYLNFQERSWVDGEEKEEEKEELPQANNIEET